MKEEIRKTAILTAQIDRSCDLHITGDFISSLSLGGVAECLSDELLKQTDNKSYSDYVVRFIRFIHEQRTKISRSGVDILREKNWARNMVKHHRKGDSESVRINFEFESFLVNKAAIANYESLGFGKTPTMKRFDAHTKEYG